MKSEKFNGENFANQITLILYENLLKELMLIIVQQISVLNVFGAQLGGFLALFLCSDRGPARPNGKLYYNLSIIQLAAN